jgi:hypothetical protein
MQVRSIVAVAAALATASGLIASTAAGASPEAALRPSASQLHVKHATSGVGQAPTFTYTFKHLRSGRPALGGSGE